jgi:aspartyl-tRNA(Asn)/glutamyl-tRNA(Gln) amidotransferase subunit B
LAFDTSEYYATIGIEVQLHVRTDSKAFCACPTDYGKPANSQTCPICLGHPGTLPAPNRRMWELAIISALALNCKINPITRYDRKNYFYPDLPKGYQISQRDLPIGYDGYLEFYGDEEGEGLTRWGIDNVHIEEDTAKIIHQEKSSLLDFNRAGVPLLEIVSAPMPATPQETYFYLRALRATLVALGVSECSMELGSMRCDTNISVAKKGEGMGKKVEVKNLNSFRSVRRALEYEFERQRMMLAKGKSLEQETRHWDEQAGVTRASRSKEESADYRYFPEPDIPPIVISDEWLTELRAEIGELPLDKIKRYRGLGLNHFEAITLAERPALADYFESCLKSLSSPKLVATWVVGDLSALGASGNLEPADFPVQPEMLAKLLRLVETQAVSGPVAKEVLARCWASGESPEKIVEREGLKQISDEGELGETIQQVIDNNPEIVQTILAGKDKAVGRLVGEVMKLTKGRANPQLVNQLLADALAKLKK